MGYGLFEETLDLSQKYYGSDGSILGEVNSPSVWAYKSTSGGVSGRPHSSTLNYSCLKGVTFPSMVTVDYDRLPTESMTGVTNFNIYAYLYPEAFLGDISLDRCIRDAKSSLLEDLGGAQFQSPVWLAELGKTGEQVESLARGARATAKWLRTLNPKQWLLKAIRQETSIRIKGSGLPDALLSKLSDAWMVWRYTICTTLLDVDDALQSIVKVRYDRPEAHVATARKRRSSAGTFSVPASLTNPYAPYLLGSTYIATNSRYNVNVVVKAWARARIVSNPGRLIHTLGLNPLQVAWELLPGSFIADWALNVGDYIQSATAMAGLSIEDGGLGVAIYVQGVTQSIVGKSTFDMKWETSSYSRTRVLPEVAWSGLSDSPLNWKRWLDAAAIFRGLADTRGYNIRALTGNH